MSNWLLVPRRLCILAFVCALLVSCSAATPRQAGDFDRFLDRMDAAQRELQQGRAGAYRSLWSQAPDVTLGGGFGGGFVQGWPAVSERLDWAATQFRDGRNEIRRVAHSGAGDVAYLVQVEQLHFTATETGAAAQRTYRVTMLFRREDGEWRIFHRHADAQAPKAAPR